MKSHTRRLVVGGAVLLLVVGVAHRWWPKSAPIQASDVADVPAVDTPQSAPRLSRSPIQPRPSNGVRFEKASSSFTAPDPGLDEVLYVSWQRHWYRAEILQAANGSNYIRYTGYGPEWDEWVMPDRMQYASVDSAPPPLIPEPEPEVAASTGNVRMTPFPGDTVVLHGNRWWRAEVLQTQGGQNLIRYVGYGAEWDEWVGADRFKIYSEQDAANATPVPSTAPETASVIQGKPAQGDLLVEWGQQWWPAEIVQQDGNRFRIHYKGYGDHWDEWVDLGRLTVFTGE